MYKILGADQKEYGPVTLDQLRQWLTEGRANAQTMVQGPNSTEWKPLGAHPELAGMVPTASLPGPAPAPAYAMGGAQPPVPNYLWQSIAVTVCCCLPLGVAAIVFATQVNSKMGVGDVPGAMEASRKARLFCWLAFGLGLVSNIIFVILGSMDAFANLGKN